VRISGSSATAVSGGALGLTACNPADPAAAPPPVALGGGKHVLRTAEGKESGVDFDRVVLSSAAGGEAASVADLVATAGRGEAAESPRVRVLKEDSTSMTVRVDDASDPFWMVLGQSLNKGWKATVDGEDLGEPTLVDGFANGWLVRPSGSGPITIKLEWEPQNVVNVALLLSVLGGLACLAIIFVAQLRWRRRKRDARAYAREHPDAPPDPELEPTVLQPEFASPFVARGKRPSAGVIALTTIVAGAVSAAIVRPWVGLLVAAAVLLVLLRPRWRAVLSLFPFVALGLCGLYVAVVQFRSRYPVGLEWPGAFWRARTLGWLAIVFLAADVLVGLARRGERQDDPEPEPDAADPPPDDLDADATPVRGTTG
jgi:hypothetical protein